jgi:hypothetical protein
MTSPITRLRCPGSAAIVRSTMVACSMPCFRIRRFTTLPQHVDRGPQRCASLDGMYSISTCSKSLSAGAMLSGRRGADRYVRDRPAHSAGRLPGRQTSLQTAQQPSAARCGAGSTLTRNMSAR